jgi:hypothetical protein
MTEATSKTYDALCRAEIGGVGGRAVLSVAAPSFAEACARASVLMHLRFPLAEGWARHVLTVLHQREGKA